MMTRRSTRDLRSSALHDCLADWYRTEYALEGSVFVGGAAVQWLRDQLQIVSTSAETESLAASLALMMACNFVPALTGLGAPYWTLPRAGPSIGLHPRHHQGASGSRCPGGDRLSNAGRGGHMMCAELGLPLRKLQVDGGACATIS